MMKTFIVFQIIILTILTTCIVTSSSDNKERLKRTANTVGGAIGSRGGTPNKRKPQGKITPPLRLGPGETPEQAPGWKHCIKNMRANLIWKSFMSPGYPDFLESQIQCSWIIEAPKGMKVRLAFRDLNMVGKTGSCAKQFVQIVDVAIGKSQGRYCGSTRPGDYVTLGTRLRLDLQADKAVTDVRGFLLSYTAVNQISGFRTEKSFPAMVSNKESGGGGLVDMKSFVSNSNKNLPKPSPGSKRASKKLIYESDSNPQMTDPSGTTTQSGPSNSAENEDLGWIGDDNSINTNDGRSRGPSGGPLKVQTRNRPTPGLNKPIIITASRPPVRILANRPLVPIKPVNEEGDEEEVEDTGPIIYGQDNQPFDPSLYSTEFPVRSDRVDDHRPEELSVTSLIAIVASSAVLLLMLLFVVVFWCCYRKRKAKKRKAKAEQKKKEEQRKENDLELKVMNLGQDNEGLKMGETERQRTGRQQPLPLGQHQNDELPPRYQRELSLPRYGAMERMDSLHGEHLRDRQSHSPPRPREMIGREDIRHMSRHDMPSHIQLRNDEIRHREMLRHEELRHNGPPRPYYPEMQHNRPDQALRHQSMDRPGKPLRHRPPSPIRHQTLDPRRLKMNRSPMEEGYSNYPRREPPRYPSDGYPGGNSRVPFDNRRANFPRSDSRPLPPVPQYNVTKNKHGKNDVDEDYCSGDSDVGGAGKTPMRREYSPWELEQQKREKRKQLINGDI